jgi:N-acetylated-alpha-linked acidic dipeptidase
MPVPFAWKRRLACLGLVVALLGAAPPARAGDAGGPPLLGFTAARAEGQRSLEARFDSLLRRDGMKEWMRRLTAHPHHLGSPYDRSNAEYLAGLLRSWGYDTAIEEFRVLFPVPRSRRLELLSPTRFTASLREPPVPGDATSGQASEQLPLYNAYSTDGDVTGELVYVNHGVPEDYEELERRGVDVRGRIVLARYGGSWRGIKPKVAAEHGALGCVLYSDPAEDGYFRGDAYPKGGYRNDRSGQRGSVIEMTLYPGDPLTPGVGATADAKRLDRGDAPTLTKIPVLPISYADALPLLRALGGPVAPESWRGALPLTYHVGPGPARVRLALSFDWRLVPAWDVVAKLAGAERPDEWVLRGNHHDAWAYGAWDPVSGTVVVLEEARAVAALARSGWRPRRTMVYALWDGEEAGLIGSTEWAETHADELRARAAVYINSDGNGRGFFGAGGSPALEAFVSQALRDVTDPEKGVSVLQRARARTILRGSPEDRKDAREGADLRLAALGSGSDYTPFLQHLGVPSLDIGFGGEGDYGQYHSIYDSYDHFLRFGDPDFVYGLALAKTSGRMMLRFADADVLPFAFGGLGRAVGRYVKEVAKLADDLRDEAAEQGRRLAEGSDRDVFDPRETYVPPKPEPAVPFLDFAPLLNASARLETSARTYDAALWTRLAADGAPLGDDAQRDLDAALMQCERALTRPGGLPRRPWYTHQLYAPGFYTGYGVKTLPGVREAIEQKDWSGFAVQVGVTAGALESCAARIDSATALLRDSGLE